MAVPVALLHEARATELTLVRPVGDVRTYVVNHGAAFPELGWTPRAVEHLPFSARCAALGQAGNVVLAEGTTRQI